MASSFLNASLASLLECPICSEYMSAPIFLCSNGHNICAKCRRKLAICPTCRADFISVRNLFAEHMSEKLLFSCDNAEQGCNEKMSPQRLADHVTVCPHRLYSCLPGLKYGCSWVGRRHQIHAHVREAHEVRARMKEDNNIFIDNFDLTEELYGAQIISAHDEIFWYRVKRDPIIKKFYIAVQYIGPRENASNFKYTLKFYSKNDVCKLVFSNYTLTDTEDIDDVYEMGNCLSVDLGFMKNFITPSNTVEFKLKVEKCVVV